ncbi:type II toxin-antitoxin system HigB family toxin [Candidatus Woesearchaeota archaeon]|nr:MAG: type II toxin-antitoxin system HigB family toxin [Candidatus Woesearchaeota archaeon]
MHVISKKTLTSFWNISQYQETEEPLKSWYAETKTASWRTPMDVKEKYSSASIIKNNRVVFNIAGNKYRLIVKIHYNTGIVYIRFLGTHAEYDKIDAETI